MRLVLDSEVQRMTGGLQVLAVTNSLRDDDFQNFRRIALGFVDQYGKGGLVLISDRKGRLLFSSATEDTASLPPRGHLEIIEKVFAPDRRNIPTCSPARSTAGRCLRSRFRCSATAK